MIKHLHLCPQVEFESVKLELTHKDEELELMRAQLEEAGRLREIAECQLDEALEALKEEREQKNSLRRELATLTLNPFDSIGHFEVQLDDSRDGEKEKEAGEEEEEEMDSGYNNSKGMERNRCSTPRNSDVFLRPQAPGLVADLLSELHLSDSQKLKQQLLQVRNPLHILHAPHSLDELLQCFCIKVHKLETFRELFVCIYVLLPDFVLHSLTYKFNLANKVSDACFTYWTKDLLNVALQILHSANL